MPLDITYGATTATGNVHSDPECPMRDISHPTEGSDIALAYGANDLWDAIHAHPDFHDLILDTENRDDNAGELLDIIAEQTNIICGACKDRVLKGIYLALALRGEVMTAEARHVADNPESDHTIVSIHPAPEGLWMEDALHEFPDRTEQGYGYLTVHHRVAFFALMEEDGERWVEARSLDGTPLMDEHAGGPCDSVLADQWICSGHFRPAPNPTPVTD